MALPILQDFENETEAYEYAISVLKDADWDDEADNAVEILEEILQNSRNRMM